MPLRIGDRGWWNPSASSSTFDEHADVLDDLISASGRVASRTLEHRRLKDEVRGAPTWHCPPCTMRCLACYDVKEAVKRSVRVVSGYSEEAGSGDGGGGRRPAGAGEKSGTRVAGRDSGDGGAAYP